MSSRKVRFMPADIAVEVETGTRRMEAAENAGVHIDNLCGGKGVCGRCRVRIANGKIHADKLHYNGTAEWAQGLGD